MRRGKRLGAVSRVATVALVLLLAAGGGAFVAPVAAHADTVRELQWYLDALKIPQAHKQSKGRGVVVAVIDTGVDASHPDLRGQVLAGTGIGPGSSADGRTDPDTAVGHGTGMAGIIAGRGGGDRRQLGIAPEAKILPVSVGTNPDGGSAALAIRWAADSGANVINLSIGGDGPSSAEEQAAVQYALERDVVLVSSAGNTEQGSRSVGRPANIPGVIAVTGTDEAGRFSSGSVQGPESVLAAPADAIISPRPFTVSENGYGVGSKGTSSAAAIVSGIVALVRAKYPDLDAANVINRLISTARDEGPSGRDPQYGFGVVDPVAALTRSVPAVEANPLLPVERPGGAPDAGGDDDGGSWIEFGVTNSLGAVIQVGACLLVLVLVVVLIVVGQRSSRRRRRAAGPVRVGVPAGTGPPQPGGPWAAPPGGPWPGQPGVGPGGAPGYPPPRPQPGYPPAGGPGHPPGPGVPGHPPPHAPVPPPEAGGRS